MASQPPPGYTPPAPDPPLTLEQKALVAQLSDRDIEAIDDALLSNSTGRWRKVAMVVALTMADLPNCRPGIPDLFYAQRIKELVRAGRLDADGNLAYMRFSEVRLPAKEP